MAGLASENLAAGDLVVRGQAQPGGKVLLTRPFREIRADLAEDRHQVQRPETLDGRQVHAVEPRQVILQIEGWLALALGLASSRARRLGRHGRLGARRREGLQQRLHLGLTGGQLGGVKIIAFQRLAHGEDVLGAVLTGQRLDQVLARALETCFRMGGQLGGVGFALGDGPENRQATHAGDIAHGMVQVEVHLIERLLHAADVIRRQADEGRPLTPAGAQALQVERQAEGGLQQPERMELAQPLAIQHIGFAAGYVLGRTGIHHDHGEAALFQQVEEGNPIDARGFQGHRRHATGVEPVGEGAEIGGVRAEFAHGSLGRVIIGHSDEV